LLLPTLMKLSRFDSVRNHGDIYLPISGLNERSERQARANELFRISSNFPPERALQFVGKL
jgi:hypothetical protein